MRKSNTGGAVGTGGRVTTGDLRADLGGAIQAQKQRTSSGLSAYTLCIARVVTIDYKDHTVTLKVIAGADQEFLRNPVTLTQPGMGARHFMGSMPEVGSYCVVGHLAQETDGRTTTPVILSWLPAGTWMGHDWMVSQPFAPAEWSMDPKDAHFVAGQFARKRHKLRHMEPGNIVCSSAQGSDLVLNEDVLLTNRRGNEVRLRDNDQALVERAQQKFTVLGGTRIYSGMVQRDATFLPTQMFDMGVEWDGPRLYSPSENRPLTDVELRALGSDRPFGQLKPNAVFDRATDGVIGARKSGVFFEPSVDPYDFLVRGGYISDGQAKDAKVTSDAVYGGKPYWRVSREIDDGGNHLNAAIGGSLQSKAYTEHRTEISHVWDGTLPVSDQTDDFDADRLPRAEGGVSSHKPFIEHVMGTVVGNDPYSAVGRTLYGKPIKPRVFDESGSPAPSMESANGQPEGDQAAFLFRMFPPTVTSGPETWTSFTKDGRFLAALQGPQTQRYGAEIFSRSGIRVATGGVLRLEADGGLELKINNGDSSDNLGLNLNSNNGAVRIYGGGKQNLGSAGKQSAPTDGGQGDQPNVVVEGRDNVEIKGARRILNNANKVETRASEIKHAAMSVVSWQAGDRINMSSKTLDQTINGQVSTNISGPKDNNPANGTLRRTAIVPTFPGVADEYLLALGDRDETLLAGNHTTSVTVGNLTYEAVAGTFTARAGVVGAANELVVDVTAGISGSALVGNISFNTTDPINGLATFASLNGTSVKTSIGQTVVTGSTGVTLGGPLALPTRQGRILCEGDLDPLTGLPFTTFGMGSPGHIIGPHIP